MSDDEPLTLLEKVAAIRDSVGIIRMQSTEGERSFEFAPAEDVLRRVKPQLKKHRLVALPEITGVEPRKGVTSVRLSITLRDLDKPDVELAQMWEGEAESGLAAAIKNALKTFYLATFQIRTEPAEAAPRRRAKRDTGKDGLLGDDEGAHMGPIRETARQSGLNEDELAELLRERFGTLKLEHVPMKRSTEANDIIRGAGQHKAAGRSHLTRDGDRAVKA